MLYILFAVLLGAVCSRYALVTDYMIASKVSLVGVLFLFGLYVSSLSSCLGAQYGAPRVLQCISNENVFPIFKPLGKGVSTDQYVGNRRIPLSSESSSPPKVTLIFGLF